MHHNSMHPRKANEIEDARWVRTKPTASTEKELVPMPK